MKKIILILFLCLSVSQSVPVYGGSLLTKSEDFTKVATYGLNLATYTAEKKDGKEAAAKLISFDIIWDIMGKGEEFFLNGDPDAFPKFKDDVLKVMLILDKVAEVSTKIGAGEYDDALIASVDGVVGTVNHPVVNSLWEVVKLSYESHKLVKSTKAALQIETLYGVVNNDRRLIGSKSGDAPALLPVDSDTVTYFFNKYLISDTGTRELVKAYVKTKLGEDFPEISTTMWDYLTGSSEAIRNEHELQQLQAFENVSRRWIKALLEDLNTQVKKEWSETRFRQEAEKFKLFSAQFASSLAGMDDIIAYYTKLKNLEKQKAQFPIKLEEFRKIKSEAQAKLGAADSLGKIAIRGKLFKLSEDCNLYTVNSMILNEAELERQFEALQIEVLSLVVAIDKEIAGADREKIVEEVYQSDPPQSYEASVNAVYKPLLELYSISFSEYKIPPSEEVKGYLSNNDLENALRLTKEWTIYQDKLFAEAELKFNQSLPKLYSSTPHIVSSNYDQRLKIWEKFEKDTLPGLYNPEKDLSDYVNKAPVWQIAEKKLYTAKETILSVNKLRYDNDQKLLSSMIDYFMLEVKRVSDAVFQNRIAFGVFQQKLSGTYGKGYTEISDFNPDQIPETWPSVPQDALEHLGKNSYTAIGKIDDEGVTLKTIGNHILSKTGQIMAPMSSHNAFAASLSAISGEIYRLDTIRDDWKKFPVLDAETIAQYNDLASPTKEQAEERAAFVVTYNIKESNSIRNLFGRLDGYKPSIDKMTRLINSINTGIMKSQAQQYLNNVDTDLNNRQRDQEYLEKLSKQWERWYADQITNNILVLDRESGKMIIGAGLRRSKEGNFAIINEPYEHYALEEELKKNDNIEKSKNDLIKLEVYTFIQNNMPNTKLLLESVFNAKDFEPAKEENFFLGEAILWKSDLIKAEKLIGEIDIKKDNSYRGKLIEVSQLLPYTVSFPEVKKGKENDYAAKWQSQYGLFNDKLTVDHLQTFELGKQFVQLRVLVQDLIAAKGRLSDQERSRLNAEEELARDKAKEEQQGKSEQEKSNVVSSSISTLYDQFKQAYESRNDSQVISFMGDDWEAGDGTTLSDLQENIGRSFRTFDEIRYNIQNLKIELRSEGRYMVSYDVTITSRIYKRNMKHEEKSSVNEEVVIDGSGKPRITRTMSGRFWYVE
ncbi:MAG: hypothetical protein WC836_14980 [Desulfobacula sp.]|jgi:hypothetical protein